MAARKKVFTVNGKKYPVKEFDFNMVCELEEMGVSIDDLGKKPMSVLRAYVGACMNMDKDEAGKEIEEHMINVGNFDEIFEIISYEVENSGFFRSLSKATEA